MSTAIDVPSQVWTVDDHTTDFDVPPVDSAGYRYALDNRPDWPAAECARITTEISRDGGETWQMESENTFHGHVMGKNGVLIPAATTSSEWGMILIDGVLTVRRPDAMRIVVHVTTEFTGALSVFWLT